jgi:hypothetical protein
MKPIAAVAFLASLMFVRHALWQLSQSSGIGQEDLRKAASKLVVGMRREDALQLLGTNMSGELTGL